MGYKLYAHSVAELRRFFELMGFRQYGEMDDGYIRWIYYGEAQRRLDTVSRMGQ